MLVTHKLIMMYRFLSPEINILCLMSYVKKVFDYDLIFPHDVLKIFLNQYSCEMSVVFVEYLDRKTYSPNVKMLN
jgi:hypothetical protein